MTSILEQEKLQAAFKEYIDYDELLNCTRCGFCLPSCPTYIETGNNEVHSPRGRIALMKGVVDGLIEVTEEVKESIDLCLGCRACEPVCPSGVNFGQLLEQAREAIYQTKKMSLGEKAARNIAFDKLFPNHDRMISTVGLLRFYQKSGLQTVTRRLGILKFFPEPLELMERVLPEVPKRKEMKRRPTYITSDGQEGKKLAFFTGCLMDTMFLDINNKTMKLLQYAGCDIVIPDIQGCCGALHGHSGERERAKEMAKKNIKAFEDAEVDYIITNAGGCGAFLVEYDYLLQDDTAWAERAKQFTSKIKDVTSILVDLNFHKKPLKVDNQIVTYQDSCHLRNGQNTYREPRILLEAISGMEYKEMTQADSCCGSAGIYNIVQPEMSMKILDDKMAHVKETKAQTIVTTNPGCLLQMKLGVEREGLSEHVRAIHIVELLIEAYEQARTIS